MWGALDRRPRWLKRQEGRLVRGGPDTGIVGIWLGGRVLLQLQERHVVMPMQLLRSILSPAGVS